VRQYWVLSYHCCYHDYSYIMSIQHLLLPNSLSSKGTITGTDLCMSLRCQHLALAAVYAACACGPHACRAPSSLTCTLLAGQGPLLSPTTLTV
jgi:hypothetical protein